MTTLGLTQSRILTGLTAGMGLLALTGGAFGLLSPVEWSTGFGLPLSTTTTSRQSLSLARAASARNVGSGLGVLALLATGHRRALGITLLTGVSVAWLDAWIVGSADEGVEGKAMGHAIMGAIVAGLGAGLVYTTGGF